MGFHYMCRTENRKLKSCFLVHGHPSPLCLSKHVNFISCTFVNLNSLPIHHHTLLLEKEPSLMRSCLLSPTCPIQSWLARQYE